MDKNKVYVVVTARFTVDGRMYPISLTWEDGRTFEIDKVLRCERCASRKAGGAGILYTCMIRGRESRLFYEENYRWFMERKGA